MKHVYLFILCFSIGTVFAQQNNIVINLEGDATDISGSSYSVNAPSEQSFDINFEIHNNTGTPYDWHIARRKVSVPNGWSDGLCWGHSTDPFGGTCFSSGQMDSVFWINYPNTNFTTNDSEYAKLKAQIDPADGNFGTATYRYYIGIDSAGVNNMDSVDLIVNYTASIANQDEPLSIAIIPNPASQYIKISLNGSENASLSIYDVLGQRIKKTTISGSKKINVSNYKNGIYFISVKVPGKKTISRKVVIRH